MSKESIIKEWEEHKGEFILTQSHTLERFIGIGADIEDYYWITYNGRTVNWNSCVGKLIYLKGKIDDSDYQGFIREAKLNHYDQKGWGDFRQDAYNESVDEHRQRIIKCGEGDFYLTDICWDLN